MRRIGLEKINLCAILTVFISLKIFAAPCSSPSKPEGSIIFNSDYNVPQYCDGTNWIAMGAKNTGLTSPLHYIKSVTISSQTANQVWGDGSFLYVADDGTGIDVYRVNATTGDLTFTATEKTIATNSRSVWADVNFIYVADNFSGVDVYKVDPSTGTLTFKATDTVNSTNARGVFSDGTFLYVADGAGGGLDVYTVNSSTGSLTFKTTDTVSATNCRGVWGNGSFVFLADFSAGVQVYTADAGSGALTLKASNSTNSTQALFVWGDSDFLYVADGTGGIDVYTVNPVTGALTFKSTNTTNTIDARGVWKDNDYLYVADYAGGLDVYSVNAVTGALTLVVSDSTHSTQASGVWGDGSYIFVADFSGGIDVYARYNPSAPGYCYSPSKSAGAIMYNPDYRKMQYCDGSTWHILNPNYTAWGVTFNGSLQLSWPSSFGIDSTKGLASFWFRRSNGNSAQQIIFCVEGGTANCRFQIDLTTGHQLHIRGNSSGGAQPGTTRMEMTGSTAITDTNWHHALISFDGADTTGCTTTVSTGNCKIYLDGVAETVTVNTTFANIDIDFTRTGYSLGTFQGGTNGFFGDLADFYFNMGTYLDLSQSANREKFRASNGYPVELGSNGAQPTGTVPEIFFSDSQKTKWLINKGTPQDWVNTGGFLNKANTSPSLPCSHSTLLKFETTDTTNTGNAGRIWVNNDYIFVVDGGTAIDAYTFNGSTLTYKGTVNVTVNNLWSDGTFIYVAAGNAGLRIYTFDGTSFTLKSFDSSNSTNARGVWGETKVGTKLAYVGDGIGGIDVYEVNPTTGVLTFKTTDAVNIVAGDAVWADGTFIYVSESSNFTIYTYDVGTSVLTIKKNSGALAVDAQSFWGDGTYIYTSPSSGANPVWAYFYDRVDLFAKGSYTTESTPAASVWGDGTYIYVAGNQSGLDVLIFDGTTFSVVAESDPAYTTQGAYGVGLKGSFIIVGDGSGGVDVYRKQVNFGACTCSSPTGKEGTLVYNIDYHVLQYCDGRQWRSIGK
jgi:6-phosphogluconolactonase (cycloisomerase 2 family)